MRTALLQLALLTLAVAAYADSTALEQLAAAAPAEGAAVVAAPAVAAGAVQATSDLDRFVGEYTIVSCNTDWKKGDWSMWYYSNSHITQVLQDQFSAASADGGVRLLAAKIQIERKDGPEGVGLLIYGADSSGNRLNTGRDQSYEMFFMHIDQPAASSGKTGRKNPDTNMETTCPDGPYPDCYVTQYPDLTLAHEGSSWAASLKPTASGMVLQQSYHDNEDTRKLSSLYLHRSSVDDDAVKNSMELSAAGQLTYAVREQGQYRPDGSGYPGAHITADKWDVQQKCVFQRDSPTTLAAK